MLCMLSSCTCLVLKQPPHITAKAFEVDILASSSPEEPQSIITSRLGLLHSGDGLDTLKSLKKADSSWRIRLHIKRNCTITLQKKSQNRQQASKQVRGPRDDRLMGPETPYHEPRRCKKTETHRPSMRLISYLCRVGEQGWHSI